ERRGQVHLRDGPAVHHADRGPRHGPLVEETGAGVADGAQVAAEAAAGAGGPAVVLRAGEAAAVVAAVPDRLRVARVQCRVGGGVAHVEGAEVDVAEGGPGQGGPDADDVARVVAGRVRGGVGEEAVAAVELRLASAVGVVVVRQVARRAAV